MSQPSGMPHKTHTARFRVERWRHLASEELTTRGVHPQPDSRSRKGVVVGLLDS